MPDEKKQAEEKSIGKVLDELTQGKRNARVFFERCKVRAEDLQKRVRV